MSICLLKSRHIRRIKRSYSFIVGFKCNSRGHLLKKEARLSSFWVGTTTNSGNKVLDGENADPNIHSEKMLLISIYSEIIWLLGWPRD